MQIAAVVTDGVFYAPVAVIYVASERVFDAVVAKEAAPDLKLHKRLLLILLQKLLLLMLLELAIITRYKLLNGIIPQLIDVHF